MNIDYAIGFMNFIITALPISKMMRKYHNFPCFLPYKMPFVIDVIDAENISKQMLQRSHATLISVLGKLLMSLW